MTTTAFDKAFGTNELSLSDLILKVHDAVPNRDKRHWELLSKATEAMLGQRAPDLSMLASALEDAARERINEMIVAVQSAEDALTHDQAKAAVLSTDVGSALSEILDMAERAAIEASPLTKQIDASLAKKAAERNLIDHAKELQVEKAREGRHLSLLQAIETAKAIG